MKKILKNLLFLTVIFYVSFFIVPQMENVYAESAIYFDKDGNFVFSTYDKIATGKVIYKTIGWIIKKYEEPLGALGQLGVVMPTPNYSYEIQDKNNPGYKYTYFVMDGNKVLDFIYGISGEWGDYLKKYGGIVYLDSVMTVVENGVYKGGLDNSGNGYGEVYIDYNGISTARGWANPYCLKEYFDIPVAFPAFIKEPDNVIVKNKSEAVKMFMGNSAMAGITLGSHEKETQEYDIALGVPSGEDIYAYGVADKYYNEGTLTKVTGIAGIPVKVTTDYILRWTDINGQSREERVNVSRYYYVQKDFEYYEIDDFKVYELNGVTVSGGCIEKTDYAIEVPRLNVAMKKYGDIEEHIRLTGGNIYAGEKVVYSSDNRKPDIPEENQEELANKSNVSVKMRNDSLVVGDTVILSDEWSDRCEYKNLASSEREVIYKTGIIINEKAANGQYNDMGAVYTYVCGDSIKNIPVKAEAVTVHTPIVCRAGVSAPKKYNMAVEPKANQLTAGADFSIICNNSGMHRDIKGYGNKNYGMYMDKGYVRFPFEVVINNKSYSENTWIELNGTAEVCHIPESVALGEYKIEYAAVAKNGDITDINGALNNGAFGEGANMELTQYGAVSSIDVQVIGTISGFSIELNGTDSGIAYVGNRIGFKDKVPENSYTLPLALEETNQQLRLRVKSCGIGQAAEDKIIGNISYYYIKDGERKEADVYVCGKHDILGGAAYERLTDRVEFTENDKVLAAEGVYQWEKSLEFGESLLAMPKGVVPDNEDIVQQYALKDGNILINFDIYGYSGNNCEYSYINVENFKKGYCNMWKTEGYLYNFVDKIGNEYVLKDGDSIILEILGGIYEDYEIVGTH